jgi:hypothetical protein
MAQSPAVVEATHVPRAWRGLRIGGQADRGANDARGGAAEQPTGGGMMPLRAGECVYGSPSQYVGRNSWPVVSSFCRLSAIGGPGLFRALLLLLGVGLASCSTKQNQNVPLLRAQDCLGAPVRPVVPACSVIARAHRVAHQNGESLDGYQLSELSYSYVSHEWRVSYELVPRVRGEVRAVWFNEDSSQSHYFRGR